MNMFCDKCRTLNGHRALTNIQVLGSCAQVVYYSVLRHYHRYHLTIMMCRRPLQHIFPLFMGENENSKVGKIVNKNKNLIYSFANYSQHMRM